MPKKITLPHTTEELKKLYLDEGYTLNGTCTNSRSRTHCRS